ncbi:MAG: hypothetical protein WAS21_12020 [Geminicoccaceae bacterium]
MQLRHAPSMLLLLSPLVLVGLITVVLALRFAPDGTNPAVGIRQQVVEMHGPA